MHKVENHCGLHSVNFLIYHIGMEVVLYYLPYFYLYF